MKYLGTKTIETDRLILRKIKIEDIPIAYDNWCKSDNNKYVLYEKHENIDVTKKLFKTWIDLYDDPKTFRWMVELKENHNLYGIIDVSNKFIKYGTCEIGYCYAEKYWNKGYGTEALKAVIQYLFEKCDADTICAEHMEKNIASGRVMQKAGMKFDGRTRSRVVDKNGKRNDLLCYSILKDEYFKNKKD